ncbi:MAG: TspO/MBR family protein [Gemmatimonadaceae bacterium]
MKTTRRGRGPRITRDRAGVALAAFVAVTAIAPAIGIRQSPANPRIARWYRGLAKPPFTPPSAAFGPVWTTLYALIAASGWRVWRAPSSPERTRALVLWGVQQALNTAWSPLFFGEQRIVAALADIILLDASATAYALAARRVDKPAAAMMIPYLAWLSLATALNAEIVRRN